MAAVMERVLDILDDTVALVVHHYDDVALSCTAATAREVMPPLPRPGGPR